jgi:general secretion pathway protein M
VNGLIDGARDWWAGRSQREQRMLAVMGGALALFFLWFAVVQPIVGWRAAAEERLIRARNEQAVIVDGLARLKGRGGARPLAAAAALPVAEAAAAAAGLTPQLQPDGTGRRLAFTIDSAPAPAVLGWLAALERDHGMRVAELTVVENADATVQAQGTLAGGA